MIIHGDCLEMLKELPDNSLDSMITDPPAGISFMNKSWDDDKGGRKEWITWMSEVMKECLRVLKPGAHGLVWAIPRTSHWTATALEDAGFEVRDVITHLFGSGFPKSLDISKAIDKAAGAGREVIGISPNWRESKRDREKYGSLEVRGDNAGLLTGPPLTPEAKQWQGFGTALKPASEHWILVRKPCSEKTVAANVLKWGCGGINIDASRISGAKRSPEFKNPESELGYHKGSSNKNLVDWDASQGRFPANLLLSHNPDCVEVGTKKVKGDSPKARNRKTNSMTFADEEGMDPNAHVAPNGYASPDGTETVSAFECTDGCAVAELDRQSGVLKSGAFKQKGLSANSEQPGGWKTGNRVEKDFGPANSGGASRFFYCAKASKADKGVGNTHPTVKASKLMAYLIKMITPPQGIVLDPFMGSGSTGVAALKEGFEFIGIEREAEYVTIAEARMGIKNSN